MVFRLRVNKKTLAALHERLHEAYRKGQTAVIRRIHALLFLIDGKSVQEVALILNLSRQTIYNYLNAFLVKGLKSLVYKKPSGRPKKLTKTQRKELAKLIENGRILAGYDCGVWDSAMIQDLILTKFQVKYSARYISELLKNMGFSYQKARFVSHHIDNVAEAREEWMNKEWPEIMRIAKQKEAMILFGDEASFAQWGSLSYTWAPKGKQPTVKTSGKRRGYKIFGLIDYFSGAFFYKSQTGKFNSESYQKFLEEVLAKTTGHLIIIQDGARYHTSKVMQNFFNENKERITIRQLPKYSPEFNPIEFLWKKMKKQATHLRYFPTFNDLVKKVDEKLKLFSTLPREILSLMGRYVRSLGAEVD